MIQNSYWANLSNDRHSVLHKTMKKRKCLMRKDRYSAQSGTDILNCVKEKTNIKVKFIRPLPSLVIEFWRQ